jgi:hypothetical protein
MKRSLLDRRRGRLMFHSAEHLLAAAAAQVPLETRSVNEKVDPSSFWLARLNPSSIASFDLWRRIRGALALLQN